MDRFIDYTWKKFGGGAGDFVCFCSACQTFIELTGDTIYVNDGDNQSCRFYGDIIPAYKNGKFMLGNKGIEMETGYISHRAKSAGNYFNMLGRFLHSFGIEVKNSPRLKLPQFDVVKNNCYKAFIQPLATWALNPSDEYIQSIIDTFHNKYDVELYVLGHVKTPKRFKNVNYSLLCNKITDVMKLVQNASIILTPRSLSANLASGYNIPSFVWSPNDGELWHINYPNWDNRKCTFDIGIEETKTNLIKFLEEFNITDKL